MGLLDLFSTKSSSQTQNTTTENNLVETVNRNVSGNAGLTATEGSTAIDNSVRITTDEGAIAGATGLAQSALDTVSAANRETLNANAVIADQALKSVSGAYGQALTAVSENADNTSTIVSNLATQFGTRLADLTASESTQLGNVVSALSNSYESRNTSANQQVLDSQTNLVKYVALAAAVAFVGFLLLRKG